MSENTLACDNFLSLHLQYMIMAPQLRLRFVPSVVFTFAFIYALHSSSIGLQVIILSRSILPHLIKIETFNVFLFDIKNLLQE